MKKRFFTAVLAVLVSVVSYAQETVIGKAQLPKVVQQNITKYFGNKNISSIVKDREGLKVVYDVYFADQTEAEFASNGELKEVKNYNRVPDNVVPKKILAYVKRQYSGAVITHWEKERNKQKVELNNGLELEFDLRGNFLRLDD
ncbi:MAG: PepSY-like domain-containing protein [Flavobacteriaceae bacterium]|nr:PepSY-like domain-containing protein [Flavobacteriaceae bacterium]